MPFNRRFTEGPRGQRYLRVVGRLRPGVSVDEGREDVARVGREISQANAFYGASGRQFETVALHLDATRDVRTPLLVLSVGVGILLLMACVNVASLLVARAAGRARETAMKAALGAGIGRIVRQHVIESLLLAGSRWRGGTGIGPAGGCRCCWRPRPRRSAACSWPPSAPRSSPSAWARSSAWTMLLAAAPLSEALKLNLVEALRSDGQRAGRGPSAGLRRGLTVAQLALSVVLVVAALLLIRTVDASRTSIRDSARTARSRSGSPRRDRAIRTRRRSTPSPPAAGRARRAARRDRRFGDQPRPVRSRPELGRPLPCEPGRRSIGGAAGRLPRGRSRDDGTARRAPRRGPDVHRERRSAWRAGRDGGRAPGRAHLAGRVADRPATRRGSLGDRHALDVGDGGRAGRGTCATAAPPKRCASRSIFPSDRCRATLRDDREDRRGAVGLVAAGAGAVGRLDAALPIYDVRPLEVYVGRAQAIRRFTALLAAVFAAAALLLAAVGVYGVIAYSVSARRREFGVRLALGARASQIVTAVVRESTLLVTAGLLVGIAAAVVGAWWLRSQLFEVAPWDIVSLAATVLILGTGCGPGQCPAGAARAADRSGRSPPRGLKGPVDDESSRSAAARHRRPCLRPQVVARDQPARFDPGTGSCRGGAASGRWPPQHLGAGRARRLLEVRGVAQVGGREAGDSFPLEGSNWFARPARGQAGPEAWKRDVALLGRTHADWSTSLAGSRTATSTASPAARRSARSSSSPVSPPTTSITRGRSRSSSAWWLASPEPL